jgi:hypothetical protein
MAPWARPALAAAAWSARRVLNRRERAVRLEASQVPDRYEVEIASGAAHLEITAE